MDHISTLKHSTVFICLGTAAKLCKRRANRVHDGIFAPRALKGDASNPRFENPTQESDEH